MDTFDHHDHLTDEDALILTDLAQATRLYLRAKPFNVHLMLDTIEEVAAGNAGMFPRIINRARQDLKAAGILNLPQNVERFHPRTLP